MQEPRQPTTTPVAVTGTLPKPSASLPNGIEKTYILMTWKMGAGDAGEDLPKVGWELYRDV